MITGRGKVSWVQINRGSTHTPTEDWIYGREVALEGNTADATGSRCHYLPLLEDDHILISD